MSVTVMSDWNRQMQGIVPLTESGTIQLEGPFPLGKAHAVQCGRGKA